MSILCPNCSADLPDDAVFCDQCGASLSTPGAPAAVPAAPVAPAAEALCPSCGASAIPGEAFCDNCGASLAEPAIAAPAAAAAPAPEPAPEPAPAAEPAAAPALVACPACGVENLPGSRFCSNCGLRMDEVAPEPAPAAEPLPELAPVPEPAGLLEDDTIEEVRTPPPAPVPADLPETPEPTGKPRFVVRDTGAEIPLPTGEGDYLIGREDPVSNVFPTVDMNPHQGEHYGVSRRHAQLTIEAGLVFIEDLDSTNFTFVNRTKLAPNAPTALSNGDEVRLGKLVLTYLE